MDMSYPPVPATAPRLMTLPEAAQHFACSLSMLHRAIAEGRLELKLHGETAFVLEDEVRAALESLSTGETIAVGPRKRIYSIKEAAVYLGTSAANAYKLIYRGKLRAFKGSGSRRWKVDILDLEDYVVRMKSHAN